MAGRRDIQAGKAYVSMYVRNKAMIRGLRNAQARLRAFGSGVQAIGIKMLRMGAVMAVPFVFATRTFMGFEDQMLTVKAVTGAVGDEFDKLYAKAKLLGRTTSFMAAEVAGGMIELGRGGFSPAEIDASIASVLNLARATGTELPRAAEIAAGTLRAFNLEADQMTHVGDVMVATANNSAQTLEQLGDSMTYAAPIAQEFGLTLEETSKALGVMANMQIKGSMAGTSMRMILLQLSDPSIRKKLQGMGVDLSDFGKTMTGVGQAMAKMSGVERLDFAKKIFGQRAAGGALKLARSDFPALSDAIDNATGKAAKAAKVMDSGLGGAWRRMMSAVEGVKIAIGESLGDTLTITMERINFISSAITKFIKENKGLVVSALKVTVAIIAAGAAVTIAGSGILGLATIAGAAAVVVIALGMAFSAILSPIGLVVAAVIGLVAYFGWASSSITGITGWLGKIFDVLKTDALAAFDGIANALKAGNIKLAAKILWAFLKVEWTRGVNKLKSIWAGFTSFWNDMTLGLAKKFIDAAAKIMTAQVELVGFLKKATGKGVEGAQYSYYDRKTGKMYTGVDAETQRRKGRVEQRRKELQGIIGEDIGRNTKKDAAELAKRQAELDAAKKELDDLVAESEKPAEAPPKPPPGLGAPGAPGKPGTPLPTAAAIGGTAVGTFSAAASRLMGGGGSIPQRQLKVAEKQLKKADDLLAVDKKLLREVKANRLTYIA